MRGFPLSYSGWLRGCPQFEILASVVVSATVPMMNRLVWLKVTTQRFLHHKPVLHDVISRRAVRVVVGFEHNIPTGRFRLPAPARVRSKALDCVPAREAVSQVFSAPAAITNVVDEYPARAPAILAGSSNRKAALFFVSTRMLLQSLIVEVQERSCRFGHFSWLQGSRSTSHGNPS
ncbi:hypothetical protein LCGC14_1995470 [marine sediment metagenome]|uniref:Uncharacterized protein n=1 Tax=marine sediment metagenome TaxID=412755 RepID=A0A0F9F4N4_9ZZZZ